MANKMLIDAAHPEETRVVVLRGNRVEEFDFESANRKQLRGNIYLAKVTRVEPSLQAAFVDYGGNRHGFLAFSEIHPDYYQIPVADRQALIEAEEAEMAEAEARLADRDRSRRRGSKAEATERPSVSEPAPEEGAGLDEGNGAEELGTEAGSSDEPIPVSAEPPAGDSADAPQPPVSADANDENAPVAAEGEAAESREGAGEAHADGPSVGEGDGNGDGHVVSDDAVESVGAEDAMEEVPERRVRSRVRQYKIQEVIKRRQILLVQVVKEERGNKGAALTTYLSLAGRYSVLMPNTARGGGISRKITSITDRKRLKQVVSDLEVPPGMGVILRTAGASRTRAEVKRDFEYLLRLWENVRELTLRSTAPTLVYEEGSLIKRSIRDLYNKDIDEVTVAGDEGYREAKDFMRMLMPSHAKNIKPYKDGQPLFARFAIEAQLDAMFSPQVTLRSGGYIVINQTEALVSIDVNSGRSTREHNIEDTALQTNLEAAEEVARQLRLRDLAGLIVIDFIDMEEKRNNRSVERKLKDALKNDRARIQVGRISHFGLLEMSRQRIRTGVLESTTTVCPTCQGTGHIRAPSSVALHVLRSLEDTLLKGATHNLTIRTRTNVALYILNQKRSHLSEIEQRFGLTITVAADETIANGAHFAIERGEPIEPRALVAPSVTPASVEPEVEPEVVEVDDAEETEAQIVVDDSYVGGMQDDHPAARDDRGGDEGGQRRRRRRRGRGRGGEARGEHRQPDHRRGDHPNGAPQPPPQHRGQPQPAPRADDEASEGGESERPYAATELGPDGQPRKRRRGRRGGRRGRRGRNGDHRQYSERDAQPGNEQPAFGNSYGEIAADPNEIDTTPTMDDMPRAERSDPIPPSYPDDDDVDTTPRIDTPPSRESQPRVDPVRDNYAPPDEIDTTAQPDPRPSRDTASGPGAAADEAEDPNRPKRSGWWQRRSFFG
jgi:ribonuclease E